MNKPTQFTVEKFAAVLRDDEVALSNYEKSLNQTRQQLGVARQALINVPNVAPTLAAIDESLRVNANMYAQFNTVKQRQQEMYTQFSQIYLEYKALERTLDPIQSANDQLRLN